MKQNNYKLSLVILIAKKIGIKQMFFEDVYLDDNFVYFGSNNEKKVEVKLKE